MEAKRTQHSKRLDAWLAFLRAHSRVTAMLEQELEATEGLPVTWFDALVQLRGAPGRQLRMQELGEALAMTASGLSRRISRMEQAGLVERRPCPDDRRGVLVVLTEAGERRYQAARPVHMRGVERYFLQHLSDAEAATLSDVFGRVLAGVEGPDS